MKKIIMLSVLAVAVPALFFVLAGCMKKPEHKPDYGPEVPVAEVAAAIGELQTVDPENIQVGEYVNYTVIQQLGTGNPVVAGQVSYTLLSKVDEGDRYLFTFNERIEDRSFEPPRISDSPPIPLYLMKQTQALSIAGFQKLVPASESFNILNYKLGTFRPMTEAASRFTYHKLQTETGFMPIPQAVKDSPNCGGLARCDRDLRTQTVAYDEVEWVSESLGNRTSFRITISPDVPYLSYKVRQCDQAFYPRKGADIGLTVCREATNFKFHN
jgi:hypothetical protein